MSTEPPPLTPAERYFPIAYEESALDAEPEQFKRLGLLVVRGEGDTATYTFTRGSRLSDSAGGDAPIIVGAQQIANVSLAGRRIQFHVLTHQQGGLLQNFTFYGATPDAAAVIASLLPRTRDDDRAESLEFLAKLDEHHAGRPSWLTVTHVIIALNLLAYVAMGLAGAGWVQTADMLPYLRYGANNGAATTDGEWWRLTTSNFLHFGLMHLAFNMAALVSLGRMMERLLGSALFTLVYFGSGLAGSLLSLAWNGDRITSAGASGAVFGLMGACVGYMLREKHALPRSIYKPSLRSAGMFIAYNALFGLMVPNLDHAGHVGGLIGGFLLGWLVAVPADRELRRQLVPGRLQLGAVLIVAMFAAGVIYLPRYDYRLREKIAWEQAFFPDNDRDNALIATLNQSLVKHRDGEPDVPLVRQLRGEVVPFNERWIARLEALPLSPELRTARHRDAGLHVLRTRLAAYRQLTTDLEHNNPDAIATFRRAEGEVDAAIREFNRLQ